MIIPPQAPKRRGPRSSKNPQQCRFRAKLQELMTARGLSQNQLGRACGVSPANVNRLLKGLPSDAPRQASRTLVLQLAEVFALGDYDTDELLWLGGHAPITNYQQTCSTLVDALDHLVTAYERAVLALQSGELGSSELSSDGNGRTGRFA